MAENQVPAPISNQNLGTQQTAPSPIDFIKSALATPTQTKIQDAIPGIVTPPQELPQVVTPQNPLPPVTPPHATPIEKVDSPAAADAFVSSLLSSDIPQNPAQTSSSPTVPPVPLEEGEAPLEGEDTKKTPQESLKEMRKTFLKTRGEKEKVETELTQTREELEKYRTGEAVSDVLKEKEERIKQLEQYERLHALKLSPEYQKKFVEPHNVAVEEATKLASDYGVDPSVIEEALSIDNKRELNSFLRNNFDDVGALEFRTSLDKIRGIRQGAQVAEAQPAEAMKQLQAQYQASQVHVEQKRISTIQSNARQAWSDALRELETTGQYPELTLTGNAEQDKIANEIRAAAAKEYGATVTLLGQQGVKDLPIDAAKILAKRFQLSQAAAIMSQSRAHHYTRSEELLNQTRRQASMVRPQVGGMVESQGAAPVQSTQNKPKNPIEDSAEQLLNSVLQKRR